MRVTVNYIVYVVPLDVVKGSICRVFENVLPSVWPVMDLGMIELDVYGDLAISVQLYFMESYTWERDPDEHL